MAEEYAIFFSTVKSLQDEQRIGFWTSFWIAKF